LKDQEKAMPPQRTGLGRGLDALIPGDFQPEAPAGKGGVKQVGVGQITPNPRQPRVVFDAAELSELAASIRAHGILQPRVVSPPAPGQLTLIAGERRRQAARQVGLKEVPVIERETSDLERLQLALIENVQRADLNPLEEAEAYRQLSEEFGLSHEMIAAQVGKSRVAVTNTLRLLNLTDKVKQALVKGAHPKDENADHAFQFSAGHARALLGLSTPEAQNAALETVLSRELTVRETEELVRKFGGEKPEKPVKAAAAPEIADLEERLRSSLGTKATLRHGKKGGTLTLHYYSDEELESILGRLLDE
jgi:ParB family chromosome partitioning protein